MARIVRRPAAQEDLIEHAVHLAIEAGGAVADRFLDAAERSFELLARQPTIGAPVRLADPRLSGLRKWAVTGFEKDLIFYIPTSDDVAPCVCCTPPATGRRSSA